MSLRIGIFVMSFPQRSETFIVTKVLKLLDAGCNVQIFAVKESSEWGAFDVLANRDDVRARVHVVPPLAPWSKTLTTGALSMLETAASHPRAFARYLEHCWQTRGDTSASLFTSIYTRLPFVGKELDILHIEFDAQGIGIADLRRYLNCRVLLSSRGTLQQLSLLDRDPHACEYLFRYADGYHFISRFLEGNTTKLGLPADVPTWLIEPAIDLSLFDPSIKPPRTGGPLRIISVGRLSWEKGYESAVDAVARLRASGVAIDYTIYGAGPDEQPIRFAIHQHGLTDCTRLAGALRREQMPAAYANADVMLHAAFAEGFCNAVIEAQAMEVPVVTTDAGGLPENVEDGVTGFVVPRRDVKALTEKLAILANDPALRKTLGRAGNVRARQRFDLDRQAEAFLRLYKHLATLPRRGDGPG